MKDSVDTRREVFSIMKKRFLAGLMTIAMAASMLAGCGGTVVEEAPPSEAAQSSAAAGETAAGTRL